MKALTTMTVLMLLVAMGLPAGVGVSLCQRMSTVHLAGGCEACEQDPARPDPAPAPSCCQTAAAESVAVSGSSVTGPACCVRQDRPATVTCLIDTRSAEKHLSIVTVPVVRAAPLSPSPVSPRLASELRPRPPPGPLYLQYCILLV